MLAIVLQSRRVGELDGAIKISTFGELTVGGEHAWLICRGQGDLTQKEGILHSFQERSVAMRASCNHGGCLPRDADAEGGDA